MMDAEMNMDGWGAVVSIDKIDTNLQVEENYVISDWNGIQVLVLSMNRKPEYVMY